MTELQKATLKSLPQDKKVKFLNILRFDILASGDPNKKISDLDMMTATQGEIIEAFNRATTESQNS